MSTTPVRTKAVPAGKPNPHRGVRFQIASQPQRGVRRTVSDPTAPTLLAAVSRVVNQARRNRQSFGRNFADQKLQCYQNSTQAPVQPICQSTKGRVGCPELHHNQVPPSSEAHQAPTVKQATQCVQSEDTPGQQEPCRLSGRTADPTNQEEVFERQLC